MLNRFTFSLKNRLRNQSEFQRVFKQRKRIFSQHFVVYFFNNGLPYSRLGTVVSKRSVKQSVSRNRLKRLVKEMFRQHRHHLTGVDLVFVARRKKLPRDNQPIWQSLNELFEQLYACRKQSHSR